MPVAVGDILGIRGLDLSLVAGRAGRANRIRWVHVSELEDPTQWLKGSELLLTTGMGVGTTAAQQRRYLDRLVEAGLAGLGFGTGFSFKGVPRAIATAAERRGFPVFEVPYAIPFIAITEAVFTRLLAEQYEGLQRAMDAQQVLTRTVLDGGGVEGLTRALATAVHGWSAVLDLHGIPAAVWPASARTRVAKLWEELRESRPERAGFSLSVADRSQHVVIQPVGARGHVEAFLAVGKREALAPFDRIVAAHALSLLAIEMDKSRAVAEAERKLRGDALEALAEGGARAVDAARGLRRFGFRPGATVAALAVRSSAPAGDLEWALTDVLSRRGGGFLTSVTDGGVTALVEESGDLPLTAIREDLSARVGTPVVTAAGSAVPPAHADSTLREAAYALRVCRVEGRPQAGFADLGTYRLLLSMQDPGALAAFAESVLGPLEAYDRDHDGQLIPSLQAYLERNARWEQAAGDLFVHRHTLRYRIRKIAELTGRDLDSSHHRMEFWLALRARELLPAAGSSGNGDGPAT